MPSRPTQRHDQFFQTLLDQPGTAAALLRERLPAEVAALLADEPPELVPGSFVSKRLRAYRTDRLYRTRTKTGRPVLVWTLIEHKSKPEPRIALQLLGYQVQILEHWDQTEGCGPDGVLRPLPALVTMVVYHGAEPWTVPLSLAEATDADPAIRPYLLDCRYSLVDLGRIADDRLSAERRLRVGLLILKHGPLGRARRRQLLKIARLALDLGYNDLVTMIYYLLGHLVDDPRGELARGILSELVPGEEERVMSQIVEQWKAEGFNLGLLKGLAEGKAEGKTEGFNLGRLKGLAEGKAEGFDLGMREGETKGKAEILLRLLRHRFASLPDPVEPLVRAADSDMLDIWTERILSGRTLDDIFAPDHSSDQN